MKIKPRYYITADTHFGHKNIIEYASRPFNDVEEMNEALIRNWNDVVGPDDIIIHAGDFSFMKKNRIKGIVDRLNGRKWIVLGNHDRKCPDYWHELGFEHWFYQPILIKKWNIIISHEPLVNPPVLNLHGHTHESSVSGDIPGRHFCVSVEQRDYKPWHLPYMQDISLTDIEQIIHPHYSREFHNNMNA